MVRNLINYYTVKGSYIISSTSISMFDQFICTADIRENYVFKETIGEGAFAEVKKAIYIQQDKPVAIKCIDKNRMSPEDLRVYKNQCEIMFTLEHPNIIEVYQVYDNPDYFYIVMEYMEGGELNDPKNTHRCRTQSQICQIIKTLADALDYCHSNNIVHRDIKPENILWSTNDEEAILKIADFGFAKISNNTLMTTACGTPLFISPEILNGQPYDRSVDFWSLGIILYIMLSGKSPFEAEDQGQLYAHIKSGAIHFTDNSWNYVSTSAKDLICKLLEKNPKKRYRAEDIRRHPWINGEHVNDLNYPDRESNLQNFDIGRKIKKIQVIIGLTLDDIKQGSIMQESGEDSQ